MGITAKIKKLSDKAILALGKLAIARGEYRNIHRKKALLGKVVLTDEQENDIQAFYRRHFGKKISSNWHRLYQSYTGTYCVDYFPEILFSTKLEPLVNNMNHAVFMEDKNLLYRVFANVGDVYLPKTYGSCILGVYQNENGVVCDFDQLIARLADIGACVIKKTKETSSGRDVMLCNFQNGIDTKTQMQVSAVLRQFGKDFVVQEKIQQLTTLATLNQTSVNTFRVISYICDNEIHVCPIALRLGRSNADRDNIHYGGICVGIQQDGTLRKWAFSEFGETFTAHPDSGVTFEGYKIPEAVKLADAAKSLHNHMPYLGIISWDFTIDKNGRITLIEMNTSGQSAWFPQMVNGEPLFGEDTPKMLEMIGKRG